MKNKYKGLFVLKNSIYENIAKDILRDPIDERYEKLGSPIFNRSGEYYLRDGTYWIEDGMGMAIFYLRKAKEMRKFLINLHLSSKKSLSDKEYIATKYIIEAKLPGYKKIKNFIFYYNENLYLNNMRKGFNSHHSKLKYMKL